MSELLDHVTTLPDQLNCNQCNAYRGEKPQNLAKHIALVHSMLDLFLQNHNLVQAKRKEVMARPKKIVIGDTCPGKIIHHSFLFTKVFPKHTKSRVIQNINPFLYFLVCLEKISKRDSRVHVIWHFMDELRELVSQFPDTTKCAFCTYTNPKIEKLAKHVGLGHSELDNLLQDHDLMSEKQKIAAMKQKKTILSQNYPQQLIVAPPTMNNSRGYNEDETEICPICDITLQDNECYGDHVAGEHFMDELLEYVSTFDDTAQCPLCPFNSEELEILGKHLAIDHAKLDDLLADESLIQSKRMMAANPDYGDNLIPSYC